MSVEITSLLQRLRTRSVPMFPFDLTPPDTVPLDLSDDNAEVKQLDFTTAEPFADYIHRTLESAGARAGIGGYGEHRTFYLRSPLFRGAPASEPRTFHLGIDVWAAAGTRVFTPLSATVNSLADNEGFGNYGPTLILEYQHEDTVFYALFGHLSRRSLRELKPGQPLPAGAPVGELGAPDENGNWPPHLHFQLIAELDGYRGDYPGVCPPSEKEVWLRRCPDPNLLLHYRMEEG